ncbi:2-oxoacid:acceptor oxidoreductase subunit alpha [bacterium AH-315-M10]|nr:2-oxoacid:acceptor oxidoreductase subunit alpha [bacterium AH-315-M10]
MTTAATKDLQQLDRVTILFCGDSGDGMQLTGTQFTSTSASFGNDVSTFPDFPAEIRAPAGSLAGVSGFQLNFSSHEIHTPGDRPNVLVAMNPAALQVNLALLEPGGILIANSDAFGKGNLKKALFESNPLEDEDLQSKYQIHAVPITTLTLNALEQVDMAKRGKERSKNLFALGLLYWLYSRPIEPTLEWIKGKFGRIPAVSEANCLALKAGYFYGETAEAFTVHYEVPKADPKPGTYRLITGNEAAALGFATAAHMAGKPLVYSTYPITPASDILHNLAKLKQFDVRTIQAEDEIAGMGMTIGAAFGGVFAMTGTSGPGICLKSEALGLAVMLELPMVIVNVQRGGPSTGLPTKTEQSDLLQAMYCRNGESPIAIIAPARPSECFAMAIEAWRIAVRHMGPVIYLSDGYIANGAEPWLIPKLSELEAIQVEHLTDPENYLSYKRDETTLARPWVIPGTPGLEHRLGGLEKQEETGNVCYIPENHQLMTDLRAEKVARIANDIPEQEVEGASKGKVLVLSWGGTYGACLSAVNNLNKAGHSVGLAHLRYLNPFPRNLEQILARFERVLIPELNMGQLSLLIRSRFMVDAVSYNKVTGLPFVISELEAQIKELL